MMMRICIYAGRGAAICVARIIPYGWLTRYRIILSVRVLKFGFGLGMKASRTPADGAR